MTLTIARPCKARQDETENYTVADKKNCHPAQIYSEKSYKIGFTSLIAINIIKLGNMLVLKLVEIINSYFFELSWLVLGQHLGVGAKRSQPHNDSKDHNATQCTTMPKNFFNMNRCLHMMAWILVVCGFG